MTTNEYNTHKQILVTVIIATRNSAKSIETCIRSVIEQTIRPEIVIVDGNSSDNTLEILSKFRQDISKIVSEPDGGIYDALNKGVRMASGEYIYVLGSDDYLASDTSLGELLSVGDSDIVYGDVYIKQINGVTAFSESISLNNFKYKMPFSHQGAAVKRYLLLQSPFGNSPASDYRFLFLMYLRNRSFRRVNTKVAYYTMGGFSDKNQLISTIDRLAINFELRGIRAVDVALFYSYHVLRSLLRHLFKRVFSTRTKYQE